VKVGKYKKRDEHDFENAARIKNNKKQAITAAKNHCRLSGLQCSQHFRIFGISGQRRTLKSATILSRERYMRFLKTRRELN
jgi:hypothetical protein